MHRKLFLFKVNAIFDVCFSSAWPEFNVRAHSKSKDAGARNIKGLRSAEGVKGFTIAELLISLLILGEIATFTIPKILTAQQNQRFNAIAKEDIATIAQAFQQASLYGTVTSNTSAADLIQYVNYIQQDTSSQFDDAYGYAGSQTCSAASPCAKMANGSIIQFNNCRFNGTNGQGNLIEMFVDPDGRVTSGGGATTDGKSVRAFVYYSGRVVSWSGVVGGSGSSCYGWGAGTDPPYLQW